MCLEVFQNIYCMHYVFYVLLYALRAMNYKEKLELPSSHVLITPLSHVWST